MGRAASWRRSQTCSRTCGAPPPAGALRRRPAPRAHSMLRAPGAKLQAWRVAQACSLASFAEPRACSPLSSAPDSPLSLSLSLSSPLTTADQRPTCCCLFLDCYWAGRGRWVEPLQQSVSGVLTPGDRPPALLSGDEINISIISVLCVSGPCLFVLGVRRGALSSRSPQPFLAPTPCLSGARAIAIAARSVRAVHHIYLLSLVALGSCLRYTLHL